MHYAGARYYMSALGRWNGPDPLADAFPGHSSYNYSLNNPINLVDPNGMEPCPYDESQECGVIMDELVVEAERPKKTASYGMVNGTFYFNSSTRAGRGGLYDFMRSNPGATRQMIGNNNYSMAAQQVAFNANIHNGQALFLNNSARVLSYASLITGTGAGVLGARMLLANSGRILTSTAARITALESATTGFSLTSSVSFAASGDLDNAKIAATGALVGWGSTFGRMVQATRGLRAAPRMNGVLYRSATTGQTVKNSVFGARYGLQTLGSFGSAYLSGEAAGIYLVEPSK